MARSRLILVAALALLCAAALAGGPAASAQGAAPAAPVHAAARARAAHAHTAHAHARRRARCGRKASFHAGHGVTHHRRRPPARCQRHRRAHAPSHRSPHPAAGHGLHSGASHSSGAGCPDAGAVPTQFNVEQIRAATLCLVNREREAHGERPLAVNANLQHAAQSHSEDMAFGDYFEHVGPHGDTPLARMRAAGYVYSSRVGYEVGENIGWGTLWLGSPRAIVAAWMASPGHRDNILDPRFRDTAIGVSAHVPFSSARHQAGGLYTQDFGVIVTR